MGSPWAIVDTDGRLHVSSVGSSVLMVDGGLVSATNPVPIMPPLLGYLKVGGSVYQATDPWITSGISNVGFIDSTGSIMHLKFNAEAPQVCAQDYLQALAEGDIAGHTPFVKQGYNTNLGTAEMDLWGVNAKYVFPVTPQRMYVVSSNAADDKNGIGVRQIKISYLNGNYVEKSETVNLSGTTLMYTAGSDIYRVNRFRAVTCGGSYAAIGDIDLCGSSTATIYTRLNAGLTRGRNSFYTVPSGTTLYLTNMFTAAGESTKPTLFTLRATYNDSSNEILTSGLFFMPLAETLLTSQAVDVPFEIPIKLPATVDLKISAKANAAGTTGIATLRGWQE